MVVAYEFYWHNPKKKYQLIGVLPELGKNPKRVTQESIISWGRNILGKEMDSNDIFFIKIAKDANTGRNLWLNSVYRPLRELRK
jgi:hypothetical protein